jgi:hypothetical protein
VVYGLSEPPVEKAFVTSSGFVLALLCENPYSRAYRIEPTILLKSPKYPSGQDITGGKKHRFCPKGDIFVRLDQDNRKIIVIFSVSLERGLHGWSPLLFGLGFVMPCSFPPPALANQSTRIRDGERLCPGQCRKVDNQVVTGRELPDKLLWRVIGKFGVRAQLAL